MNRKKAKKLLVDYLEDSLAAGPREAVENHLSQCERCRDELSLIEKVKENLVSLDAPDPGDEFWRNFNRKLSQKLAVEEAPASHPGFTFGYLTGRPRIALAAGVMTILLIALLAVGAFLVISVSPGRAPTIPDIALNSSEIATIDLNGIEIEFFLKNGDTGIDLDAAELSDLSEEEMETLEEDLFVLMGEDWASASEDMVPDDIYEPTVYDLLDELSYEEIEALYRELGLT